MMTVFVHIKLDDDWDNFKQELKHIPHKGDTISFSVDGPIYEVDSTLFNCFDCNYEVELYVHQIKS